MRPFGSGTQPVIRVVLVLIMATPFSSPAQDACPAVSKRTLSSRVFSCSAHGILAVPLALVSQSPDASGPKRLTAEPLHEVFCSARVEGIKLPRDVSSRSTPTRSMRKSRERTGRDDTYSLRHQRQSRLSENSRCAFSSIEGRFQLTY
jgi:hypothetical protein